MPRNEFLPPRFPKNCSGRRNLGQVHLQTKKNKKTWKPAGYPIFHGNNNRERMVQSKDFLAGLLGNRREQASTNQDEVFDELWYHPWEKISFHKREINPIIIQVEQRYIHEYILTWKSNKYVGLEPPTMLLKMADGKISKQRPRSAGHATKDRYKKTYTSLLLIQ
ncbi:hypothetical protein O6H91_03G090600 [Diphasiastrum complanatum]|uniref:Uncharacterized protein n=1 Tax=Diphasiastrum complanatum TaxID=34168 RepID=A0ACC2E913_DIPCM|nr:hypothetical protein O6H91_03G090600 [Diphasiastrum complanatum]